MKWLRAPRRSAARPHSPPIVSAVPETHAADRLPEMRRPYEQTGGLSEDELASTGLEEFEGWLDDVVDSGRLVEAKAEDVAPPRAPGRPRGGPRPVEGGAGG